MSRIVSVVGGALCILGVWQGLETYSFISRSEIVKARVTGVQELRGPPKPRQKTPVNLLYTDSSGHEVSAVAHLPLLQELRQGDEIRVLVDPRDQGQARMPLWSELWARPLTYIIGGMLLLLVGRVLRAKRSR